MHLISLLATVGFANIVLAIPVPLTLPHLKQAKEQMHLSVCKISTSGTFTKWESEVSFYSDMNRSKHGAMPEDTSKYISTQTNQDKTAIPKIAASGAGVFASGTYFQWKLQEEGYSKKANEVVGTGDNWFFDDWVCYKGDEQSLYVADNAAGGVKRECYSHFYCLRSSGDNAAV